MTECAVTPCPSCPWRRSNPADASRIPNFSLDKMRNLACTVGPGDEFRRMFACHLSGVTDDRERPCIGYVAVEGWTNLAVRVAAIEGRLDITAIWEACDGLDLWPSFADMLAAYEHAASTIN